MSYKGDTPDEMMDNAAKDIFSREREVEDFNGGLGKDSKDYRIHDELLTQCQLKLDKISVEGRQDLRESRKMLLSVINKSLERLEQKVTEK